MPALLLTALLAALIQAGQPRGPVQRVPGWASHGPEGGGSPVFADLRAPEPLYTVTGGGVFLSEDAGASWVPRSEGLVDLPFALVVGLDDPPALYGWSDRKFYRSLDGGL